MGCVFDTGFICFGKQLPVGCIRYKYLIQYLSVHFVDGFLCSAEALQFGPIYFILPPFRATPEALDAPRVGVELGL